MKRPNPLLINWRAQFAICQSNLFLLHHFTSIESSVNPQTKVNCNFPVYSKTEFSRSMQSPVLRVIKVASAIEMKCSWQQWMSANWYHWLLLISWTLWSKPMSQGILKKSVSTFFLLLAWLSNVSNVYSTSRTCLRGWGGWSNWINTLLPPHVYNP